MPSSKPYEADASSFAGDRSAAATPLPPPGPRLDAGGGSSGPAVFKSVASLRPIPRRGAEEEDGDEEGHGDDSSEEEDVYEALGGATLLEQSKFMERWVPYKQVCV